MVEQLKTTSARSLVYDKNFRGWLKENPAILKSLDATLRELDAMNWQQLERRPRFKSDSGEVELLGGNQSGDDYKYYRLKVSAGGASFFVKVEKDAILNYTTTKGADEYASTLSAKETLKDIPWVEVVEPLLGYQGTGRSFFVSAWRDLPRAKEYLAELAKKDQGDRSTEYAELESKTKQLIAALPEFEDIDTYNMFYDAAAKKIVLYDLGLRSLSEESRVKQRAFRARRKAA